MPMTSHTNEFTSPAGTARKVRLGVLGSGAGTNFVALAKAITAGTVQAEVVLVISDVTTAGILQRAAEFGIPAVFVDPGPCKTKLDDAAQEEIAARFRDAGAEYLICAGFMRRLKAAVLNPWDRRILNIHPSLLPQFPGRDAPAQALAAGVSETGCTVHLVDAGIDTGEILARSTVPVHQGDDCATVTARINAAEQALYPQVIQSYIHPLSAP